MIESVKSLLQPIEDATGIPALVVGIVALVIILAIIVAVVVVIVKACKKKSKAALVGREAEQSVAQSGEESLETEQVEAAEVESKVAQETTEVPAAEEALSESETVTEKTEILSSSVKKTESKKKTKKEKSPAKKLNGKWTVEIKGDGEYISKLCASNGEVMLSSEIYTTEEGARNGISTIIKGIENGKFVIYQDKNKNYYYKLKTSNNRLLCVGEIYKSQEQCLKAVETVKRIASGANVSNQLVEGAEYVDYTPAPIENDGQKKNLRGKWRIETTEDGNFTARLYASNGQLMLATEEVASEKNARNALSSVKKNVAEGNFIIDRDKFGRYYYKLRNAQKSVICIGEAYDTLESCTSAIESVRRFAANALMAESAEEK